MYNDKVRAKKRLGQHFLKNEDIARRIAEAVRTPDAHVLEIGPGMGVLTQYLLQQNFADLAVVELDEESVAYLQQHFPQLGDNLIASDFLRMDLAERYQDKFVIVGNFPYNISSQIFFKILEYKDDVPQVVGMLQKEVAERLSSGPGNKSYGILSVLLQAWYDIEYLFTVGENEFIPPPKVKSAVIRLRRNGRTELGCDDTRFKQIVKAAFNQRRKTLRNSLKAIGVDVPERYAGLRPEQMGVEDFIDLTKMI